MKIKTIAFVALLLCFLFPIAAQASEFTTLLTADSRSWTIKERRDIISDFVRKYEEYRSHDSLIGHVYFDSSCTTIHCARSIASSGGELIWIQLQEDSLHHSSIKGMLIDITSDSILEATHPIEIKTTEHSVYIDSLAMRLAWRNLGVTSGLSDSNWQKYTEGINQRMLSNSQQVELNLNAQYRTWGLIVGLASTGLALASDYLMSLQTKNAEQAVEDNDSEAYATAKTNSRAARNLRGLGWTMAGLSALVIVFHF